MIQPWWLVTVTWQGLHVTPAPIRSSIRTIRPARLIYAHSQRRIEESRSVASVVWRHIALGDAPIYDIRVRSPEEKSVNPSLGGLLWYSELF